MATSQRSNCIYLLTILADVNKIKQYARGLEKQKISHSGKNNTFDTINDQNENFLMTPDRSQQLPTSRRTASMMNQTLSPSIAQQASPKKNISKLRRHYPRSKTMSNIKKSKGLGYLSVKGSKLEAEPQISNMMYSTYTNTK